MLSGGRLLAWSGVSALMLGGVALYLTRGPAILLDVLTAGWNCL